MNETTSHGHGVAERYVHFIDRLNLRMVRAMGPPPIGPYDQVVKRVDEVVCPVCGRPMIEHTIDHSTPNAILNCPAEHKPGLPDGPVNEFGMPKPRG